MWRGDLLLRFDRSPMSFLVIFMAVIAVSGCAIIEAGPGRTRP